MLSQTLQFLTVSHSDKAKERWHAERVNVKFGAFLILAQGEAWFLFWGSASCCAYFIKVTGRTWKNKYLRCLFIFILPLHVSALADHLQEEYTIIFRKLPHSQRTDST
jgi:hypothetical protein